MLTISKENIVNLDKAFAGLQEGISDLRPFFRNLSKDHLENAVANGFDTEGYGSWKPLSKDYAYWKAQKFPGKPILRREDTYFQAATNLHHPGSYLDITPRHMEFGISESYFVAQHGYFYPSVHEEGSRSVPKRALFELLARNEMFQSLVVREAERWGRDEANTFFSKSLGGYV